MTTKTRWIYRCLWGFLFPLLATAAIAQTTAVKGVITDEKGKPAEGVTVIVQNKAKTFSRTTESDASGTFTFGRLAGQGIYSFTFTSIGFDKKVMNGYSYNPGDVITLSVQLKGQSSQLSDVVVVGYGTEKKANLTGAVDQISTEYTDNRPMSNLSRGLEGAIANLNISVTDGKPTATSTFNIRGITSIGSGTSQGALILIDGVPGDPNTLNPNDIASVSVLKDAASAAVYGARGAFGVVLINTKNAHNGKVSFTYSPSFGLMARTAVPKLESNGYQYALDFDSAYLAWYDYLSQPQNINTVIPFSLAYLDSIKYHNDNPGLPEVSINPSTGQYWYFGNTDWEKVLYAKSVPMTEQAINVSGGTDKVNFTLSGRYYNQAGIFKQNNDNFNRYNLRFKGFVKVNNWLSFNSNTDFSAYDYKYPLQPVIGSNIWQDISNSAPPLAVLHNPDGTYTMAAAYGVGGFFSGNAYTKNKQYFIRNTIGFSASILPGKLELNGDYSYLYTYSPTLTQMYPLQYSTAPGTVITSTNNYLTQSSSAENYHAANLYAHYHQHFGLHGIEVTVGGNLESDLINNQSITKQGLLVSNLPDLNIATGTVTSATGGGSQWSTAGIFYRVTYNYEEKYLVELDGRYDGSSKFPTSQQFGFFPSASAGWRINRESFMQGTRSWLDNWKIRASYGSLGNGQINPYLYLPLIASGMTSIPINGATQNYLSAPNVIPNGLTWEKSTTMDFGTDIDVLKHRLSVNFDWYQRKTTGMITQSVPLPSVFGASTPVGNNADLKTRGWEVSVNWNGQVKTSNNKPFTYGIRVTLSDYTSIITKFNNPTGILTSYYKGEHYGDIWGFVTEGFFTSQDDINTHANQKPYVVVSNSNLILPGDIKFKDLNGDGVINNGANTISNPGDQKVIGNSTPRYRFGITPSLGWNNFFLSAFFQGVGKENWWPGNEAMFFWGQYNRPYNIVPSATLDHWTPENPNGYFPRYRGYVALSGTRELSLQQTRYLQNVAYVRLKNITLGYDIPQQLITRIHIQALRIYFTGQNIFTWSPMYKHTKAYDPEVLGADPTGGSGAGNDYPMLKSYILGLNLTL